MTSLLENIQKIRPQIEEFHRSVSGEPLSHCTVVSISSTRDRPEESFGNLSFMWRAEDLYALRARNEAAAGLAACLSDIIPTDDNSDLARQAIELRDALSEYTKQTNCGDFEQVSASGTLVGPRHPEDLKALVDVRLGMTKLLNSAARRSQGVVPTI